MCSKKKENKKEKEINKDIKRENRNLIDKLLKEIKVDTLEDYIFNKLSSYRSEALRHVHYYGNIRLKYVGFNITLLAIFFAYFGFYFNLGITLNPSQINPTTLSWLIGFIIISISIFFYLYLFTKVMLNPFSTISFKHSDLSHYDGFISNYPKISDEDCNNFYEFVKKSKLELRENDLKSLLQYYFYQANYDKVGIKLRKCLFNGIKLFLIGIMSSILPTIIFFFIFFFD